MARLGHGAWYRKAKDAWYATVAGRKVSLGVRGKGNRAAAQKAWQRLMAGNTSGLPLPGTKAVTVRELAAQFLADVADRSKPKTSALYHFFLDGFTDSFGGRAADAIKPHEAEAYSRKPSWSASTRHDFLAALVTAFRWGVRAKFINANPLVDVRKPPKASRGVKVVLTSEKYAALSAAASPEFRLFLSGLWMTGCRPGELARLEAKNVDFKTGVAILTEHKSAEATGRPRVIYLTPDATALLLDRATTYPDGPLFRNSRGGAWTGWAIVKAMEAARARAGLPQAITYGLRHSFATDALSNGVPDATVAALLGHSNTAMLHKHYSHLTSQAGVLRNAAALVRPVAIPPREPPVAAPPTADRRDLATGFY